MSDRKPMDCGDNSCAFEGRSRGGMRTNGGCCCLKDLDFDKRMRAMGYIRELEAKLAEARVRLVDMYERIIPEEIAKGCALPETRVKELEAALRLGAEAYVAALPDASTDAMTDLAIERNALRQENERLREALASYDSLSLVIETAVREMRDRDSREACNYEALLRTIDLARAALRGGE